MTEPRIASRRLFLRGTLALMGTVVISRAIGTGNRPARANSPQLTWPLSGSSIPDALNSPFGPRLRASANYAYEFHPGIDLAAPLGTPVHAAADGAVRLLTDSTGRRVTTANAVADPSGTVLYPNGGMVVQLDHGGLLYTTSLHLSAQAGNLIAGSPVKQGDVIGYVGQSGTTTFDHLHFDVRSGSYYSASTVNPLGYLPMVADLSPRIVEIAMSPAAIGMDAKVTVECAREDLNLDELVLSSFDRKGRRLSEANVAFNARVNCGTDVPTAGPCLLEPAKFNRYSSLYQLNVTFSSVTVARGGHIEVKARDVAGANQSVAKRST